MVTGGCKPLPYIYTTDPTVPDVEDNIYSLLLKDGMAVTINAIRSV
jgi:hypothetical protein